MGKNEEEMMEETIDEEQSGEAGVRQPEAEEEAKDGLETAGGAQEKCGELLDKLQRTLAEFDNYRKRTAKEKAGMYDEGVKDTVAKLLPTIDNFERALAAAPDKGSSFYKGIEMTYRQLMMALTDMGVDVLPSVGEKFDLNIHHAVAHVEDGAFGENEVIEELQKGYQYKDKVIRHSMVKVAN